MSGEKRYCVIIELQAGSDLTRIRSDVPQLIAHLQSFAVKMEQGFRSNDGQLFSYFIVTSKPPGLIVKTIQGGTSFRNGDAIIVLEVGDSFSSIGFGRAGTWLQRTATPR